METEDKINAVQRMQDYIISHTDGKITIQDLSLAAGYSTYHCIRIFKDLTGKTPFEYIRAIRLTKAAEKLRDSDSRVLDIALEKGFDSHDGFTRAFYRQFNITPQKYRSEKAALRYFTYYPIRAYYQILENEGKNLPMGKVSGTVTATAVERPARKLILLRSKNAADYLTYCSEMGCDWEGILNSIPEKFDTAALLTLPQKLILEGTSDCAAGIEVPKDYAKAIPEGYDIIELPPCKMLYFQGMPYENEDDFGIAIGIASEAVSNYRPETYGFRFAAELAPRFNFGADAKSGARIAVPVE